MLNSLRLPVTNVIQQNHPVKIEAEWKGETCFLIGGGPSLSGFDSEIIRGLGRVIAINNSYQLCPWCDILYFADAQWYAWHKENLEAFKGRMITGTVVPRIDGARHVRVHPFPGLRTERDEVAGNNSGYHAINLAYHLGVKRIILLGFDMQIDASNGSTHWHAGHPDGVTPEKMAQTMRERFLPGFRNAVPQLAEAGIEVINANPGSSIDYWPRVDLDQVIKMVRSETRTI
jgi:hypothetical protein